VNSRPPPLFTTLPYTTLFRSRPDGAGMVTLDDALDNARLIVHSTDLPVAADLENGYGDRPEDAANAIRRAAEIGLVGASIEGARSEEHTSVLQSREKHVCSLL